MAKYMIPKHIGQCLIVPSRSGTPIVSNNQSGANKILIPCKSEKQAKEIVETLKSGNHNGMIHY